MENLQVQKGYALLTKALKKFVNEHPTDGEHYNEEFDLENNTRNRFSEGSLLLAGIAKPSRGAQVRFIFSLCSLWLILSACSHFGFRPKELLLADQGRSDYKIVLADDASPSTKYAATELQKYLKDIAGAELPIVSDKSKFGKREIILGDNAHLNRLGVPIDFKKLGNEGYVLRTSGQRLVIAGGALRGNLYGVYGLLEDHLGCRWFTPSVSRIPRQTRLALGPLDETQIPRLEYREPYVRDCLDGDWCARNRLNGTAASLGEKHGGKTVYFGFVHTFNSLIPPEQYYDAHPEYFSEVKGRRLKDKSQLCCTNEEVIRLVTEKIRQWMREHPEAQIFSISQNDWFNFCQCAKCSALAESEGSQIAPVLAMVNRVAEAVEKEFPDKAIDTLAYQWTRKPPQTLRPRPNVIVRLCSIECCFSHPLATCDSKENADFRRDTEDWSKICNRLWVWDYTTSFADFLVPFPNLRVLNDNIRFYADHHVTGIFEEDDYISPDGELSALGGYMMAKFLWNPDYDENKAMNEFLGGVYGAAASPIRRYIDLIHDKVEKENIHVRIWVHADAPYLTDDLLAQSDKLWSEAETAVANDPARLEQVQLARMSVDYAIIERARPKPKKGEAASDKPVWTEIAPTLPQRIKRFISTAERGGVTALREGGLPFPAYRDQLMAWLAEMQKP